MTFKITGVSKLVLVQKYKNQGWPEEKIKDHIKFLNKYFTDFEIKLRKKRKSESYIQTKFMEEFEKLCSVRQAGGKGFFRKPREF